MGVTTLAEARLAPPKTQVNCAFYRPTNVGTAQLQHARAIHGAELNSFVGISKVKLGLLEEHKITIDRAKVEKVALLAFNILFGVFLAFSFLPFESRHLGWGNGILTNLGNSGGMTFAKVSFTSLGGFDTGEQWFMFDPKTNSFVAVESDGIPEESKLVNKQLTPNDLERLIPDGYRKLFDNIFSTRYRMISERRFPVITPIFVTEFKTGILVGVGGEGVYSFPEMKGYRLGGLSSEAFDTRVFSTPSNLIFCLLLGSLKILLSIVSVIFRFAKIDDSTAKRRHLYYSCISVLILLFFMLGVMDFDLLGGMVLFGLICVSGDIYSRIMRLRTVRDA